MLEGLALNPVEFTPELPEVSLEALGLSILANPGPDYGESSATVERVRQDISEGVTNSHWPPVDCTIPLVVRGSEDLAIADPLHRLEGWVADVQRRKQGWVRRDFSTAGGFAGSVGAFVDSAGQGPPQGWEFAHEQVVPDLILKFTRYPIWFATVEEEFAEVKGVSVRDLQMELADLLGTAPGLITVRLKNEGAEDWRGCYVSLECDDFSAAPTAEAKYEAQKLTPKGGAAVAEVGGAKVVKCPPLTAGWVTVLESPIEGVGHMTHVGPRRMIFRIDDVSAELNDVKWKLEWRTLGAATWNQTMVASTPLVVSSPVVGNYQLLDMGEARPEVPVVGDPRFQWRLQAQSVSGSGKQPLIRDVYPMSTEQWARVSDASEVVIDGEPSKSPATVESVSSGTAWTNPGNAKTSDGNYAVATIATKTSLSSSLKATAFGFSLPLSALILGISVHVTRRAKGSTIFDNAVMLVKGGAIQEAVNRASKSGVPWSEAPEEKVYGGPSDLWGLAWTPTDINAAGFGVALAAATGSAAATAEVDAVSILIAYSEGSNENRICFASRSIEFTDTGIRRQHVTDETWGDVPAPEGVLLKAPAPGQAGQDARLLVIPSVGDLAGRADAATVKLAASGGYRPGYLFAREAAG
jgi:hypothetical protein